MKKGIRTVKQAIFIITVLILASHSANAQGPWPSSMNPIAPIVIVGVDSNTLYYFGGKTTVKPMYSGEFPIGRVWFSRAINRLRDANAQLIAIDFTFISIPPVSQNDINFAKAISAGPPPVVVGFDPLPRPMTEMPPVNLKRLSLPNLPASKVKALDSPALAMPFMELIQAGVLVGSLHSHKDSNGAVSRGALILKSGNYVFPSLALTIFMKTIGATPQEVRYSAGASPTLIVKDLSIPLADNGSLQLNLPPQKTLFPRYSLYNVVHIKDEFKTNATQNHLKANKKLFDSRIVLIGPTDTSLGDLKNTPAGAMYPGVEIIAATVNQLLNLWANKHGITQPQYTINQ